MSTDPRLLMATLEMEATIQAQGLSKVMREESERRAVAAAKELLDQQHELADEATLALGLKLFDIAIKHIAIQLSPRKLPELPLTGRYVVASALGRAATEE